MGKIVVTEFVSLDGVMEDPGGAEGFEHGGWTFEKALVTSEFSPLEPQTEEKVYVAGVGEISERVVKGHHEEFRLVRITHG